MRGVGERGRMAVKEAMRSAILASCLVVGWEREALRGGIVPVSGVAWSQAFHEFFISRENRTIGRGGRRISGPDRHECRALSRTGDGCMIDRFRFVWRC